VRSRNATASSFVAKVRGEVFAHFHCLFPPDVQVTLLQTAFRQAWTLLMPPLPPDFLPSCQWICLRCSRPRVSAVLSEVTTPSRSICISVPDPADAISQNAIFVRKPDSFSGLKIKKPQILYGTTLLCHNFLHRISSQADSLTLKQRWSREGSDLSHFSRCS
jgi:hypothetical protein